MRAFQKTVSGLGVVVLLLAGCGGGSDSSSDPSTPAAAADDQQASEGSVVEQSADDPVTTDEFSLTFEGDDGTATATLGGDIPEGFPLPVPNGASVGSSFGFDDENGTTYSVILSAPESDFEAIADLYEGFLNDEGFEIDRQNVSGGDTNLVMLSGTRSDAEVFISMSLQEVSNVGDQVVRETAVSLTWTPTG